MGENEQDEFGELVKLGQKLENAAFRRSFATDPLAAMQGAGIDSSDIPELVLDALAELTPAELRVLVQVKSALIRADVPDRVKALMV
jgi:hypothetical protein